MENKTYTHLGYILTKSRRSYMSKEVAYNNIIQEDTCIWVEF